MNDLEQRLRAALASVSERPPAGLLDAIARRHRRHQIRVGAGALAAAAALALVVPPAAGALTAAGGPAASVKPAASPARHVRAAPGTVLSGCQYANPGQISSNWRAGSVAHAGPVWFLGGGHSSGKLQLYVAIVVLDRMRPGSVAVVRAAPAARGSLRFLYGPVSFSRPGTDYTMRQGRPGVTFVACRPDQELVPDHGVTSYYGGYLIRGDRCVPVRIWLPGRASPALVHLGACGASAPRSRGH